MALAKIALLVLIGWLLFAPHANAPVAVGATPHVAPALPTSARVAPQAPISTK